MTPLHFAVLLIVTLCWEPADLLHQLEVVYWLTQCLNVHACLEHGQPSMSGGSIRSCIEGMHHADHLFTAADAKLAQETNPSQDRASFTSADDVPQQTADSSSGGEGAGTSGSLQQQQAIEHDPDPPECSPADDESGAMDAQQVVSMVEDTVHPADNISAAKTVEQTSPVMQQVPQTDAEPFLDRLHAADQRKADASGSKEHDASLVKSHVTSPKAVLMTRGSATLPVCQHGSQASLSRRTSGTGTASEPAAGMTADVELADKENNSSSLSVAASDMPSISASGSMIHMCVWVWVWVWAWFWVWVSMSGPPTALTTHCIATTTLTTAHQ